MEKERKLAIKLLNEFEELLDRHEINIPDDSREGVKEEARIYGIEYYNLEDKLTEILKKWKNK